jgi:hypothetical protein
MQPHWLAVRELVDIWREGIEVAEQLTRLRGSSARRLVLGFCRIHLAIAVPPCHRGALVLPAVGRRRGVRVRHELRDELRDRRLCLAYFGGQLGHAARRQLRQRRLDLEQLAQHRGAVGGLLDEPKAISSSARTA